MSRRNLELWAALTAIIAVTVLYLVAYGRLGSLPSASHLLGHGLGIMGFVLMLVTQGAYSLRKRARSARWGSVAAWLRLHVFTGLVGPYMVLVHPALRFRGLAGVLAWLTVVVVLSGVVGCYLYTRVPRTAETHSPQAAPPLSGFASSPSRPRQWPRLLATRNALATWRAIHVPLTFVLFLTAIVHIVGAVYYATLLR